MKKPGLVFLMGVLLVACNESNEQKLENLGDKVDSTAGKVWDSTKAGAERLKNNVEARIDGKDSTDKKDSL